MKLARIADDEMAGSTKCAVHRNRDAIANCIRCGKPYCSMDLERIGRGYVCFSCLKSVAKDTLRKQSYLPLTLPIMVAAGIFLAMAAAALALRAGLLLGIITAIFSTKYETSLAFLLQQNPAALRIAGIALGKAFVFGIEAYLLSMNRGISFWLGLLLSVLVLFFALAAGYTYFPNDVLLFELALPAVAFVLVLASRRDLAG